MGANLEGAVEVQSRERGLPSAERKGEVYFRKGNRREIIFTDGVAKVYVLRKCAKRINIGLTSGEKKPRR